MIRIDISSNIGIPFNDFRRIFLTELAKDTAKNTIVNWLTDPGRPYRTVRTRSGGYKKVPIYPREKIGVITGRLRSSIGYSWGVVNENLGAGEGVNEIRESRGITTLKLGTKVVYANRLTIIKYDFLERGLRDALNNFEDIVDRAFRIWMNRS